MKVFNDFDQLFLGNLRFWTIWLPVFDPQSTFPSEAALGGHLGLGVSERLFAIRSIGCLRSVICCKKNTPALIFRPGLGNSEPQHADGGAGQRKNPAGYINSIGMFLADAGEATGAGPLCVPDGVSKRFSTKLSEGSEGPEIRDDDQGNDGGRCVQG